MSLFYFFIPSDPGMTSVPFQFPKTYFKLENSSLKMIEQNQTWSEANRTCYADRAHLISIRSSLTQAYAELQVFRTKQPVWIGLNSIQVYSIQRESQCCNLKDKFNIKGQFYHVFTIN